MGGREGQAGVAPRAAAALSVTPTAVRVPGEAQRQPRPASPRPALPYAPTLLPGVAAGLLFPALPGPTCRPPRTWLCRRRTALRGRRPRLVAHCWTGLFLSNPEFWGAGHSAVQTCACLTRCCCSGLPFPGLPCSPSLGRTAAWRAGLLAREACPGPCSCLTVRCPAQVRRLSVFLPMSEPPDHVLVLKSLLPAGTASRCGHGSHRVWVSRTQMLFRSDLGPSRLKGFVAF